LNLPIVVFTFVPASAGTSDTPSGINGKFEFRVTPPNTRTSAYNDGIITATPFDATSNELTDYISTSLNDRARTIKAWVQNGVLYVSGLSPGKPWSIYHINGTLIYKGIATGDKETDNYPSLQTPGIYIIVSEGSKAVKIAFPSAR